VVVRYRIKVIDFEAKPARKLRDRDAKEAPFSSVAV
jgi:predicted trehalose synthase